MMKKELMKKIMMALYILITQKFVIWICPMRIKKKEGVLMMKIYKLWRQKKIIWIKQTTKVSLIQKLLFWAKLNLLVCNKTTRNRKIQIKYIIRQLNKIIYNSKIYPHLAKKKSLKIKKLNKNRIEKNQMNYLFQISKSRKIVFIRQQLNGFFILMRKQKSKISRKQLKV